MANSKIFQHSAIVSLEPTKEAQEFYDSVYAMSGQLLYSATSKLDEAIKKAITNKGFGDLSLDELKASATVVEHEGVKTLYIADVAICYFTEPEFNYNSENLSATGEFKFSEA